MITKIPHPVAVHADESHRKRFSTISPTAISRSGQHSHSSHDNIIVPTFPQATARSQNPSASPDTPAVTIRRAEPHDGEALTTLLADPQVFYWTSELPFPSQAHIQDLLDTSEGDRHILVATAKPDHGQDSDPEVIGMITLTVCPTPRLRHIGRLGSLAVRSDYQGHGIGSKLMQSMIDLADNWLNLLRLELLVYTDNESAIRLYRKYDFEQEGRLQAMAFRSGRYIDGFLMARING